MKYVSILDKTLDEKWWKYRPEEIEYSGHTHFRSPYESADSCGTCDGARCDYCKIVTRKATVECAIPVDVYEKYLDEKLTEMGIIHNQENISDLVYDNYTIINGDTYKIRYESAWELEEKFPIFYHSIVDDDKVIQDSINRCITKNRYLLKPPISNLKTAVSHDIEIKDKDLCHFDNQINKFWYEKRPELMEVHNVS